MQTMACHGPAQLCPVAQEDTLFQHVLLELATNLAPAMQITQQNYSSTWNTWKLRCSITLETKAACHSAVIMSLIIHLFDA
jgi:hypothetical protein